MKEEQCEVKTYHVKAICECGFEMKPTGIELLTSPPQYPHKCKNCDRTENLINIYPRIKYESQHGSDR